MKKERQKRRRQRREKGLRVQTDADFLVKHLQDFFARAPFQKLTVRF